MGGRQDQCPSVCSFTPPAHSGRAVPTKKKIKKKKSCSRFINIFVFSIPRGSVQLRFPRIFFNARRCGAEKQLTVDEPRNCLFLRGSFMQRLNPLLRLSLTTKCPTTAVPLPVEKRCNDVVNVSSRLQHKTTTGCSSFVSFQGEYHSESTGRWFEERP